MKILQNFAILLHYDQRDAMRHLKLHRSATLWLRDIYMILHLEWCQCARNRFHCANGLVVLRKCISKGKLSICAHWAKESSSSHHVLRQTSTPQLRLLLFLLRW